MTDRPDSPAAFPSRVDEPIPGGGCYRNDRPGMDLRDWFAGKTLAGLVGNMRPEREQAINNSDDEADWEASLAYHIADAMLRQREAK
jgi:hypothetical protein